MIQKRIIAGKYYREGGIQWFEDFEDGHATCTEVRCCRQWLRCDLFTNVCNTCGADYNMCGDKLAPRSQWGDETGETASDILSMDYEGSEYFE